ncbi:MAG: CapA family protein [Candidatus Nomurabacteria bacterium]|nr:MAG: CapA family protein [Candidatus Nomurabacteria bacterium]
MSARYFYPVVVIILVLGAGWFCIAQVANKIAGRAPRVYASLQDQLVYEPSTDLSEVPEESSQSMHLYAVGDIMLSRTVADKMAKKGNDYPFSGMKDILQQADAVFANLECPITAGRHIEAEELSFRANPGVEELMADANISAVSLANNHSPNFGNDGLLDTISYLDAAGIASTGAGEDLDQAEQPALLTRNGITIAIVAYTWSSLVPASYGASDTQPGTAFMDIANMQSAVQRAQEMADYVFVSMHSGIEYTYTPTQQQIDFAHAAIDAGAELVIGHHPHVVQNIEAYKGKYILYSLGNFIFDQMWSQPTREGMLADIEIDSQEGVTGLDFVPVIIDDYARPRPATDKEAEPILERLQLDKVACPCTTQTADDA